MKIKHNRSSAKMKTLLLMRHAKSDRDDSSILDHERPLTKRGRADAQKMAGFLRSIRLLPEVIFCSSAQRAQETANIMVKAAGISGEVYFLDELYQSSVDQILNLLRRVDPPQASPVMIIGHNPEAEEFLRVVCDASEKMGTATIARVDFDIAEWEQLTRSTKGKLVGIWRPKEIDEDSWKKS